MLQGTSICMYILRERISMFTQILTIFKHFQVFHIPEEEIKQLELDSSEDSEYQEVGVVLATPQTPCCAILQFLTCVVTKEHLSSCSAVSVYACLKCSNMLNVSNCCLRHSKQLGFLF